MESYIFRYFPEKKLKEVLTAFQACIGMQVQLLDENGRMLFSVGKASDFCQKFIKNLPPDTSCQKEHSRAGKQAMTLGESYIFSCHAGLNHIIFPLVSKQKMFGSVITGPFIMEEPDADLIVELTGKFRLPTKALLELADASHELVVVSPGKATEIAKLLHYLMNGINSGSQETLIINQGKLLQQSKINESIQMYKNSGIKEDREYPLDKENLLITKIRTGDTEEARAILNDLLGYLLLYENHNLEKLKTRIIELSSLLSRAAIERGSDVNMILNMNHKLIQEIEKSDNFDSLCYTFQENMNIFTESLFYSSDRNSKVIRKAAEYIANHFAENVTLANLAENIHLNPSYLSTLFKQVTGLTFKEYLNKVRIEEAQRLLANTDYPIMEIAIACGFSDQSYFTKVFKKQTGLTPKQYR